VAARRIFDEFRVSALLGLIALRTWTGKSGRSWLESGCRIRECDDGEDADAGDAVIHAAVLSEGEAALPLQTRRMMCFARASLMTWQSADQRRTLACGSDRIRCPRSSHAGACRL